MSSRTSNPVKWSCTADPPNTDLFPSCSKAKRSEVVWKLSCTYASNKAGTWYHRPLPTTTAFPQRHAQTSARSRSQPRFTLLRLSTPDAHVGIILQPAANGRPTHGTRHPRHHHAATWCAAAAAMLVRDASMARCGSMAGADATSSLGNQGSSCHPK